MASCGEGKPGPNPSGGLDDRLDVARPSPLVSGSRATLVVDHQHTFMPPRRA